MKRCGLFIISLLVCAVLFVVVRVEAKSIRIYPSLSRDEVVAKMERYEWARSVLDYAHAQSDKYVEQHTRDSMWIISRMQMYWRNRYTTPYINGAHYSRGEGEAPVPTVRFTGGRDWAGSYRTPSLESVVPYMDYRDDEIYLQNGAKEGSPWEWVEVSKTAHQVEKINLNIMNKAMYAAFIYWLDGDSRYAQFAYDILRTFTDGIYYRDAPVAEGDRRNARVVGLTSFEVIHEAVVEPMSLCYDFLRDYMSQQHIDTERMQAVFQKFADQIVVNGVADNNWNLFQARFIAYLALVLEPNKSYDNGQGRGYYADLLLNKSSARQRALKDVRDIYDPNTAMWNESPIYSTSTTKNLLETLLLLDGIEERNLLSEFEIVERAAFESLEYELPNSRTTAFGDNGYSLIDNAMFESLLTLYTRYDQEPQRQRVMAILNDRKAKGLYDRTRGATLYKLFNYVGEVDDSARLEEPLYSSMFYAPNVNLSMLRSGVDRHSALMLVNAGTGFNHNNNNGMSMELYGKGYALGIDKGRGGSYWIANHHEYYKAAVSHNTVVVDGRSTNSSREMKSGEQSPQHRLLSAYPAAGGKDAEREVAIAYADNEFHESSTNSLQRRTNGIVRVGDVGGYYVDIFRSRKLEGGDVMHEYLYHNVAQQLSFVDEQGEPLAMEPSGALTSTEQGRAKGYGYLSDSREASCQSDVRATFSLDTGADTLFMDAWINGCDGRTIHSALSPNPLKGYGGVLSKAIDSQPVPMFAIRQSGEAWLHPFVAIYEPSTSGEAGDVERVEYLLDESSDFVGVEVVHRSGGGELIMSNAMVRRVEWPSHDIVFEGVYGVLSRGGSGDVRLIFMGRGHELLAGDYGVRSVDGCATVAIEWRDGEIYVDSDGEFDLLLPRKSGSQLRYFDSEGGECVVSGSRVRVERGVRMCYRIKNR